MTATRQERIRAILTGCPELQGLEGPATAVLSRRAGLDHRNPGERLWSQGDPVTEVYIPAGGMVRISVQDSDGGFFTTALVRDCHLIGEAEVFGMLPQRFNEACVLSPQEVVRLPAGDFRQCIEASPELTRYWLQTANQRFIMTLKHAQLMAQRSAEERLRWLVRLLLGFTPASPDGMVTLPFSQETLGTMAALTRQAACKVVAEWRSRGLVDTGYQRLDILQVRHFRD